MNGAVFWNQVIILKQEDSLFLLLFLQCAMFGSLLLQVCVSCNAGVVSICSSTKVWHCQAILWVIIVTVFEMRALK